MPIPYLVGHNLTDKNTIKQEIQCPLFLCENSKGRSVTRLTTCALTALSTWEASK